MAKKTSSQSQTKVEPRGRNLEETRRTILQATFFEVLSSSFQGISIDAIVAKTPYTKGALFHQFPTKLDLGYALVEEVIAPSIITRWIDPIRVFQNPLEGILHQLQILIGNEDLEILKLGCPLNNLVQEMSPVDSGFHKRLAAALDLWIEQMDGELQRGQMMGFVKKDISTRDAATFIVMAHEGFYGTIKGLRDKRVFDSLYGALRSYLQNLATDPSSLS